MGPEAADRVSVRIDLHLHTTVSDGRSSPEDLVAEAAQAGLTTIAVTDHDTTGAWPRVAAGCPRARHVVHSRD